MCETIYSGLVAWSVCHQNMPYLLSAFTVLTVSSQGISHWHPGRPSSFIRLIPSQPHSVAHAISFLSLTVPCLRPCCFLFTNKSPLCNFCLYIQTHRNNNTIVFMRLRGGWASKQHLRGRKWFGPECTLIGWGKITSNCWMFCPFDYGMQDITVTFEIYSCEPCDSKYIYTYSTGETSHWAYISVNALEEAMFIQPKC